MQYAETIIHCPGLSIRQTDPGSMYIYIYVGKSTMRVLSMATGRVHPSKDFDLDLVTPSHQVFRRLSD